MKRFLLGVFVAACAAACGDNDNLVLDAPQAQAFVRTDLVTDAQDPNLINAWGITPGAQGFWIADNGTGKVSIYDGNGNALGNNGAITIEPGITGITTNPTTTQLLMSGNGITAPALFLFASETGSLWGWNNAINATGGVKVFSTANGVFKGVATTMVNGLARVYITDFHNGNVIMLDSGLQVMPQAFADSMLPAGFAPFGIAVIGNQVFVSFAQQDSAGHDEVDGPGLGLVDVFDLDGGLVSRFATAGDLNAPWGMVLAPSTFGRFGNTILVGNFGDGKITAFDPNSGAELGQLTDASSNLIVVDGLWGITFGTSTVGDPNAFYFAAGPGGESHGLYGRIVSTTVTTIP